MGRRFPAKCIDKLFEPIGHFFEVLHRIGKDFEPFPRPKGAGKCHTLRNSPGIWPVFGFRLSGSHPKKYKNSKLYALDPISLSEILWNSKKQPIRAGKITVLGPYFGDKAKNKAPPGRATAAGGAPKTI